MQFVVTGHDGKDEQAMTRRLAAREAHLKLFRENYDKGWFLFGYALLDEAERMIGSVIVCDFESRQALEAHWLNQEPYILGDVWRDVHIQPVKIPPFLTEK